MQITIKNIIFVILFNGSYLTNKRLKAYADIVTVGSKENKKNQEKINKYIQNIQSYSNKVGTKFSLMGDTKDYSTKFGPMTTKFHHISSLTDPQWEKFIHQINDNMEKNLKEYPKFSVDVKNNLMEYDKNGHKLKLSPVDLTIGFILKNKIIS